MKITNIVLFTTALTLAACAKTPSNIQPLNVASSEYTSYSCSKLMTLRYNTDVKLTAAIKKRKSAVAADAVGVFLVLVPVSKLAGDSEGEVAQLKGEIIAIDRARTLKSCN